MKELKLRFKRETVDSLLLAFMLNIKLLNQIVVSVIPSLSGYALIGLYVVLAAFIILSVILDGKYRAKKGMLLTVAVLLAAYAVSYSIYGNKLSITPAMFVCYVILPFFSFRNFNIKQVLFFTMWLSVLALPFSERILSYNANGAMDMSIAYFFLINTSAAILYAYSYGEWKKNAIAYLANLYCIYMLFTHGSRGVIMSLGILVILLFIIKYEPETRSAHIRQGKAAVIIIAILIIAVSFEELLIVLGGILAKLNISARFVTKSLNLLAAGNLDNGRSVFLLAGLRGFLKSPIWGNGIASFAYLNNGMVFPHNAIIQAMHDGGILLTAFLLWTGFGYSGRILKDCSKDMLMIWILFFVIAVPGSMVSHDLWGAFLWPFFAFLTNCAERRTGTDGKQEYAKPDSVNERQTT